MTNSTKKKPAPDRRLTDAMVRKAEKPSSGQRLIWDSATHGVRGFGVRITPGGSKGFFLNYRAAGRERRYTIGNYPAWSVAAARDEAARLRRLVDANQDPMEDRHKQRAAPTVKDLWARYERDYLPNNRPSTRAQYGALWEDLIEPVLGKRKLETLRYRDIDDLHRKITKGGAPYRANRAVAVLSRVFNLAIRWGWIAENPAKGIERAPEVKRQRYLSGDELRRLTAALIEYPHLETVTGPGRKATKRRRERPFPDRLRSANAIRLLLLTGARKHEVLSARWEDFDLETGIWTKPGATTKQKTVHRVPLSAPARALISEMWEGAEASPYLFPGPMPETHQKDLKRAWSGICDIAEIEGVRIHDLRHTYASMLASAGLSLPVIGALLGHTQAQTTNRYAHLFDDPLRQATERVGAIVGGSDDAEVVGLRGRK